MNTLDELWVLWQQGAEYVDVEATITAKRDRLEFFVREEYLTASFFFSTEEYEQLIYLGP
ncbi:MAG: hypothetical protein H5T96_09840 [Tissierellales bacterium]|nr:hypothetical protein [Tissierellales bacterium]